MHIKIYHRRKMLIVAAFIVGVGLILMGRLVYLMVFQSEYYQEQADALHERERSIKAERGLIYDRNGVVLADNKAVCTISVIHNQITDPERVISVLSDVLGLEEETVRKRVEKVSSIERIKANVDKAIGDEIRSYKLDGVMVDEDYTRYYPYGTLAAKLLGFTGGDNQGIIGLEVKYDEYLQGQEGFILTVTDARGIEVENVSESRVEPVPGSDLHISLDYTIQSYVQQTAEKILEQKEAKGVSIILMNPQNGEILAMTDVPEFDLNEPYTLLETDSPESTEESGDGSENDAAAASGNTAGLQEALNQMWRNGCLNDTYEPGSTFKIITSTAALETGSVTLSDRFYCPGYKIVEDRRIRCHKTVGHGAESFIEGLMNSCNPVFIEVGLRTGVEAMYEYFGKLGLLEKTGVDLPGEAGSIMHKKENVGEVELATVSFGQSFQVTPLQMLRAVSAVINGGTLVTPHLGMSAVDADGHVLSFKYEEKENAISGEVSATMRELLEKVVAEGTGKNCYIEGYRIGGKTATSQKLPRGSGKYIASFIGFAPADDPQIVGLVLIDEPVGTYYGGTIAAPVLREIFENVLPYYLGEQPAIDSETESQE